MKKLMLLLVSGSKINGFAGNFGLLLGRLGFGLTLALGHGLGKLPPSDGFISGVGEMGLPLPVLLAWAAALAEFLGSLLVAAGLFTRPAALWVLATMSVAAFIAHADAPIVGKDGPSKEAALMYLFAALIFLFAGAGKFSLDALFHKARK